METTQVALFQKKEIRKILHEGEWWFSVVDIVQALTDSVNSRDYWFKMKIRVQSEDGIQLSTLCRQLKLESSDGKKYETDCANTEGIFRIIQSIPSPKAEPFAMARGKQLEKRLGRSVVSEKNFKQIHKSRIERLHF